MDNLETTPQVREQLKVLLYHLAKNSEHPGRELQELMREVINELFAEVTAATEANRKIKLVVSNS